MPFKLVNPAALGEPHGYSNGVLCESGKLLFVSGQVAWNEKQRIVGEGFVEQFDQALANVVTVVKEAGGHPDEIARMVIYVTDKSEYIDHLRIIGEHYRSHMGKHFPAMSLVEVKGLLEPGAKVEIEAIAVVKS